MKPRLELTTASLRGPKSHLAARYDYLISSLPECCSSGLYIPLHITHPALCPLARDMPRPVNQSTKSSGGVCQKLRLPKSARLVGPKDALYRAPYLICILNGIRKACN